MGPTWDHDVYVPNNSCSDLGGVSGCRGVSRFEYSMVPVWFPEGDCTLESNAFQYIVDLTAVCFCFLHTFIDSIISTWYRSLPSVELRRVGYRARVWSTVVHGHFRSSVRGFSLRPFIPHSRRSSTTSLERNPAILRH